MYNKELESIMTAAQNLQDTMAEYRRRIVCELTEFNHSDCHKIMILVQSLETAQNAYKLILDAKAQLEEGR